MSEMNPVLDEPMSDEMDPDVARYENMPIKDVKKELKKYDLDPQPTIDAVNNLIESALANRPAKKR